MISVRQLVKRYDSKEAVRGVTFTIRPGEVTAYLGPNGAGKSTTVKMIAGLIRPTSGQIEVCGHDLQEHPLEVKRRLGYVPENSAVFASLSAEEYLTLVAELHHLEPALARERIEQMLHLFELDKVSKRQIDSYSRGQRQKVLLSAALLHDPDVLLLDEPLQGLDAHACLALRRLIEGFVQRGKTVLFCSHVLDVVERMCQRVLVLSDGLIVADDSMKDLLKRSTSGTLESVFRQLTRADDTEEGVRAFLQGLGKAV